MQLRRYKGHVNNQYKIASSLSNTDAYVVSGSEDSRICFWDLVEARATPTQHTQHDATHTQHDATRRTDS